MIRDVLLQLKTLAKQSEQDLNDARSALDVSLAFVNNTDCNRISQIIGQDLAQYYFLMMMMMMGWRRHAHDVVLFSVVIDIFVLILLFCIGQVVSL